MSLPAAEFALLPVQTQNMITQACELSPFVEHVFEQYPDALSFMTEHLDLNQPLPPPDSLTLLLQNFMAGIDTEVTQLARLRQFRHFCMAHIATRDLNNQQSITCSLTQVSDLASVLIMQAYTCAYNALQKRYGTPQGEHGPQHLYILGMGKLGGGELNFSSDIDLIFTYPASGEFSERRKPLEYQEFFIKVAQKTIHLLDTVTVDGQVYRVDMRLRPFGESGPLVMPFSAMEDYYQQQGRSWERFAMLKARILNPSDTYSAELAQILRPFIYRRYVDFSVIEALRDLKQKIVQENRRRNLVDNIKLGAGGIREVEFLAQSFQLIYGGRIKALQDPSLFCALDTIVGEALMEPHEVHALKHAYLVLRKVEHSLQQYNNAQTQTLPKTAQEQDALVAVCGPYLAQTAPNNGKDDAHTQVDFLPVKDYADLINYIHNCMAIVNGYFSALIRVDSGSTDVASEDFSIWDDLWTLSMSPAEMAASLAEPATLGFYDELQALKKNVAVYSVGDRGEAILNKLMPLFLMDIHEHFLAHSETCLKALGKIIKAVASRTTYLELMYENAQVRQQLLKFCDLSEWIIARILAYPVLLDELIHPQYLTREAHDVPAWHAAYRNELQQSLLRVEPDDHELQIQTLRQFKLAQHFRIAAADILDYLPIAQVSDKLTVLAETLLEQVVHHAWLQISEKHGVPPETSAQATGLAIIGYGKLGGIELSYSSDLDIVFIHNQDPKGSTNGPKVISTTEFYVKLVQRIMHLCSTKTLLGDLYELDLRLRPSGNSGLLISHIDSFAAYQKNEAWTWEHQALVRTRIVFGNTDITAQFKQIRHAIIGQARNPDNLAEDIVKMREKMREHLGDKDKGALADIEFLTQYWCLLHTHNVPRLVEFSDNLRQLEALGKAGVIQLETMHTLVDAYLVLRHHQHHKGLQRATVHSPTKIKNIAMQIRMIWDATFHP